MIEDNESTCDLYDWAKMVPWPGIFFFFLTHPCSACQGHQHCLRYISRGSPVRDIIRCTVRSRGFQGRLGNIIVFPFIFKMQITLVSQKNHSIKNTFRINKRKKKKREKTHQVCNSCLLNIRFITKAQPRKIAFFTGFWGGYSCTTSMFPQM